MNNVHVEESVSVSAADLWRWRLDDLGPLADDRDYAALLAEVPADLPASERAYLEGYLAGREDSRHIPRMTDVERGSRDLAPVLDELDDEYGWTNAKLRRIRKQIAAFAAIAPVGVGDQAIRQQVAERIAAIDEFDDLVSVLCD